MPSRLSRPIFLISTAVLLLVAMLLLLIGPPIPANQQFDRCVINLHVKGPFGVSLNCDSPEFIRDAAHPNELLKKDSIRQSRPGLILAAAALSKPLFFLNRYAAEHPVHFSRKDIAHSRAATLWQDGISVYAAYVILNVLLLSAAAVFYFSLVGDGKSMSVAAFSLLAVLFVNGITRVYFWSPHTQIFNLLAPLIFCWLFVFGLDRPASSRWWYGATLLLGLLSTAYGTFALYLPFILLMLFVQWCRAGYQGRHFLISLCHAALHVGLFLLPTLCWMWFVKSKTGAYYVYEAVSCHQLVWIFPLLKKDPLGLAQKLLHNYGVVIQSTLWQGRYWLMLIVGLCVAMSVRGYSALLRNRRLVATGLVMFMFISFVAFDGFIASRLAYTATIPLLMLAGFYTELLANTLNKRGALLLNCAYIISMLCYAAMILTGPVPKL